MDALKFPIGEFNPPSPITQDHIRMWIHEIEELPGRLELQTGELSPEQWEQPYRPGGWNPREVIHHIADSHLNSVVRFKLALTEDCPTIRPYDEDRWAKLGDYRVVPVQDSLEFIRALHRRWVGLLRTLSEQDLDRTFYHPEPDATYDLKTLVGLYAWHGNHHKAHIDLVLNSPA